ncbi:hypothetical protein SBRCBS47491_000682 [Sporothrix bragantina]|uniref:Glycosyl transferase CAP10 domain-containing protein n=1 Tax=Sporothrix bragantina TaxID=671064 RepID=A0ABP0ASE5_9PEZI
MLFPVLAPRRPSFLVRYVAPTFVLLLLAYSFSLPTKLHEAVTAAQLQKEHRLNYQTSSKVHQVQIPVGQKEESVHTPPAGPSTPSQPAQPAQPENEHPITFLIREANQTFTHLLAEETHSLKEAAAEYRRVRGRHPPPGFGRWHKFATERNVVMVESFWDQIYHDLHPFWALPPKLIQSEARNFDMVIKIRRGHAMTDSQWFWTQLWLDLIQTMESELPDMDLPLNPLDEPRMVVPWEAMANYAVEAERTKGFPKVEEVQTKFQTMPWGSKKEEDNQEKDRWQRDGQYWDVVRRGCSPQSAARQNDPRPLQPGQKPDLNDNFTAPHMHHGFVSNSSLAGDLCHQPDLQQLNGIFVEPLTIRSTELLLPMFGGSKLSVNNDILLPAPMYWSNEDRFAAPPDTRAWSEKQDSAVWRGVATGGHNRASNWKGFHRHRFVAMNDPALLDKASHDAAAAINFALPAPASTGPYHIAAQDQGRLGGWVAEWSDCGFVDLMCDGNDKKKEDGRKQGEEGPPNERNCSYVDGYFKVRDGIPLQDQFRSKFLPDIDGNSFSGRYHAFLKSSSLPIKATIWKEWHDARLVAWQHFVPMDNRYSDWFGIMDYFLGKSQNGQNGHDGDAAAEKIATAGREWAARVLRREDMQVYVFRLLLEYARVLDEKRELLGWVEDLVEEKSMG